MPRAKWWELSLLKRKAPGELHEELQKMTERICGKNLENGQRAGPNEARERVG